MKKVSAEWSSLAPEIKRVIEAVQEEIPVKVGRVAKVLGLTVKVATLDVGISGMIVPFTSGGYKIVINKHEPSYRQRFTLAHEISHFLLHEDYIGDGITDNILYRSNLSDSIEAEANRLASDILMPVEKIKAWKAKHREQKDADIVSPLAALFDVSEDAMRIKLGMK